MSKPEVRRAIKLVCDAFQENSVKEKDGFIAMSALMVIMAHDRGMARSSFLAMMAGAWDVSPHTVSEKGPVQ